MPNVLKRSNMVVSNLRPNSRARCQELFSSAAVGRRAISVSNLTPQRQLLNQDFAQARHGLRRLWLRRVKRQRDLR
jgi:hypothetical protein